MSLGTLSGGTGWSGDTEMSGITGCAEDTGVLEVIEWAGGTGCSEGTGWPGEQAGLRAQAGLGNRL